MQPRNPGNLLGVDVSRYQGNPCWDEVKLGGIQFAIPKATQGTTIVDSSLDYNVDGIKSNGLYLGLYHFSNPTSVQGAIDEAHFFLEQLERLGGVKILDLPIFYDLETNPGKLSGDELVEIATAWLKEVQKATKWFAMPYSYPSFLDDVIGDSTLDDNFPLLWLADYSHYKPTDHGGYTEWAFLQYSETGTVDGIDGNVDLDEMDGEVWNMLANFRQLQSDVSDLKDAVAELKGLADQPTPDWAEDAIKVLVDSGKVDPADVETSSRDFYRIVTILDRFGALNIQSNN